MVFLLDVIVQSNRETLLTVLGIGLCIGFAGAIATGAVATNMPAQRIASNTVNAPAASAEDPIAPGVGAPASPDRRTAVTRAVSATAGAVVSITTEQSTADLFARFRGQRTQSSAGSGVVIDKRGVVLTNAHVVASATNITVTFDDDRQLNADIIGLAEDLDLAVLRIPVQPDLKVASIGTSADLILGEPVVAIGNPFGLGHTVTTGVVSAVRRPLETDARVFQDFIQTDASINPGNSGGPLLNATGSLIGITTAIRPDAQGIGFAIPIDRAIKVANDLIESGTVRIPWLGVLVADVMYQLGSTRTSVPEVVHAVASSALRRGDVIVGVEGRTVQGRSDLNAFLSAYKPGDSLTLTIVRDDDGMELTVQTNSAPTDAASQQLVGRVGLAIRDAPADGLRGVFVAEVSPGGTAARLGLRRGDAITAVDGTRIQSGQDFMTMIQRAIERHRPTVLITVRRANMQGRVPLPLSSL